MKAFTVKGAEIVPTIRVSSDRQSEGSWFNRISLGKRDPGGLPSSFVLLGRESFPGQVYDLIRGSAYVSREGRVYINDGPVDDGEALVLVQIAGGSNGETFWFSLDSEEEECPNRGRSFPYRGNCPKCGSLFDLSGQHPDEGFSRRAAPFPPKGITVYQEGYKCLGQYGLGTEYLVRIVGMKPRTGFRVVRTGNPGTKIPKVVVVYWDGERLSAGSQEEVWVPEEPVLV